MSGTAGSQTRNQKGFYGSVMIPGFIMMIVTMSPLAMDFGKLALVQTELQQAVDAAAAAGAQELTRNPDMAEFHALQIAALNFAGGQSVSNESSDIQITAVLQSTATPGADQVIVEAEMAVESTFAKLIGQTHNTISVTSVGGPFGKLKKANPGQTFPIAASLDSKGGNGNGTPLYEKTVGEQFTFNINSQAVKNATFMTYQEGSRSADYIREVLDTMLDLPRSFDQIPPAVKVSDQMRLANGVKGTKYLAQDAVKAKFLAMPSVLMPVFVGDNWSSNAEVVGFITVKVDDVVINGTGSNKAVESIVVTIQKAVVFGRSGALGTSGDPVKDAALAAFAPGVPNVTQ